MSQEAKKWRDRAAERRIEGHYGWDGACAPHQTTWASQETFSVGIFKWVPTADAKGLKKGKTVYRLKGRIDRACLVYKRAEEICDLLNKGTRPIDVFRTRKSETVL